MMEAFTIEAQFTRISSRSDKSYSLAFVTSRELDPATVAVLSMAVHTEGFIAFKPGEYADSDLSAIPERKIERTDKTPSQKLRAIMYIIASQNGLDPDEYYLAEMAKLATHYKAKIAD